jgi:hypothetical protein
LTGSLPARFSGLRQGLASARRSVIRGFVFGRFVFDVAAGKLNEVS